MTREEQIIKAAKAYVKDIVTDIPASLQVAFIKGAEWSDSHQDHWHDAQSDDLPEIDKEVIVLYQPYPLENSEYAICFAHRPNKKGYLGKSMLTGNTETFYPHTYDKSGWNISNVKWWCDIMLPQQ